MFDSYPWSAALTNIHTEVNCEHPTQPSSFYQCIKSSFASHAPLCRMKIDDLPFYISEESYHIVQTRIKALEDRLQQTARSYDDRELIQFVFFMTHANDLGFFANLFNFLNYSDFLNHLKKILLCSLNGDLHYHLTKGSAPQTSQNVDLCIRKIDLEKEIKSLKETCELQKETMVLLAELLREKELFIEALQSQIELLPNPYDLEKIQEELHQLKTAQLKQQLPLCHQPQPRDKTSALTSYTNHLQTPTNQSSPQEPMPKEKASRKKIAKS